MMTRVKSLGLAVMLIASLAGCSNLTHQQQRALSGGAIGAAGGLAITALTGGSLLAGGLIGAGGGAAIGALTKSRLYGDRDFHHGAHGERNRARSALTSSP